MLFWRNILITHIVTDYYNMNSQLSLICHHTHTYIQSRISKSKVEMHSGNILIFDQSLKVVKPIYNTICLLLTRHFPLCWIFRNIFVGFILSFRILKFTFGLLFNNIHLIRCTTRGLTKNERKRKYLGLHCTLNCTIWSNATEYKWMTTFCTAFTLILASIMARFQLNSTLISEIGKIR